MPENAGFRGIGKLAGISVSERLIITSKQKGSNEKHVLVFNAFDLLSTITRNKAEGNNILLESLMLQHTELRKDIDSDIDNHYTLVELNNILPNSICLLDEESVKEYIGNNCPVKFDPAFTYSEKINNKLSENVNTYFPIEISVNESNVYKPFTNECKEPDFKPIYDEGEEPIAYCWYCENKNSCQYEDEKCSGLTYYLKGFRIGDRHLPRQTLWTSSPELSFWFWGEIHICTDVLIPSSDRSNFEHNDEREDFYKQAKAISKDLNRIARRSSTIHSAIVKTEDSIDKINIVTNSIQDGNTLPQELRREKLFNVFEALNTIKKRKGDLPSKEYQERAEQALSKASMLIDILDPSKKEINENPTEEPFYNIKEELSLSADACQVYDTIIQYLKDEFSTNQGLLEKIIIRIHDRLKQNFLK